MNLTQLEKVECFTYLCSILCTDCSSDLDIQQRIRKVQFVFTSLRKPPWNRREFFILTKSRIYTAMVQTILLYGHETWSLKLQHERGLAAYERVCLRQILRIHRQDRIYNSNIRQLCETGRDLATTVKKRRLEWLGYILQRPPEYLPCRILLVLQLLEEASRRAKEELVYPDQV